MRIVFADLHIHTCLSPCATLDMTPRKIVEQAQKKHLEIIAITDHNSAENTGSVIAAAEDSGLCVIPGIEVTTSEEAHIIGLFEHPSDALSMQTLVMTISSREKMTTTSSACRSFPTRLTKWKG